MLVKSADTVKYGWFEAEVVDTPSFLNIEVAIEFVGIMVADPRDWSVLPLGQKKRVCRSFDDRVISLYGFLFIRMGLCLVTVLKHLKVAPFQLHMMFWAYTRVFQLCGEHKSLNPSLRLFSNIFYLVHTSWEDYCNQGLISFHTDNPWFGHLTMDLRYFLGHFLLVKPHTPVTNLKIFYSPAMSSCFCKVSFLKYWSPSHRRDVLSYHTKRELFSPYEVVIKEDMYSWFQGLGYE